MWSKTVVTDQISETHFFPCDINYPVATVLAEGYNLLKVLMERAIIFKSVDGNVETVVTEPRIVFNHTFSV